jgi:phosphoglycolate phosphatase-like HAD superfamily hydrolase
MNATKVKVGERALLARVNRSLEKHNGQAVKKCRSDTREHTTLGDFYAVDARVEGVVETHIDLEALAFKMGVMKAHEKLATVGALRADLVNAMRGIAEGNITVAEAKLLSRSLREETRALNAVSRRVAVQFRLAANAGDQDAMIRINGEAQALMADFTVRV